MDTFLKLALDEYNRTLPAWRPWYRFDQLNAADQSRVEQRAEELLMETYLNEVKEQYF